MDEPDLLGHIQERECLGMGDVARPGSAFAPGEAEADPGRVGARVAQLLLLEPADAVVQRERLLLEEEGAHVVVGQDRLGLDGALRRDHPVQRRLGLHDPPGTAAGEVVLHEVGQLMVHQLGLRLVQADDEGRQPDADLPVPLVQPDDAPPDQLEQRPADLAGGSPGPGGDGLHGLEGPGQAAGQGGLLGRTDLLEDPDLEPGFRLRIAVGKPVEGVCQEPVGLVTHCSGSGGLMPPQEAAWLRPTVRRWPVRGQRHSS
ncbi:MAG: hypothetical protein AB1627_00640 [Chloroflexota bacterium]